MSKLKCFENFLLGLDSSSKVNVYEVGSWEFRFAVPIINQNGVFTATATHLISQNSESNLSVFSLTNGALVKD